MEAKDNTMGDFKEYIKRAGRPTKYETPEALWEAACEYFNWCADNPLKEEKIVNHRTGIKIVEVNKLRAYTLSGLCLFLGISENYLNNFEANNQAKKDDLLAEFMEVIARIKKTCYTQKLEGAAADLLNPNIIARDLGLVDKIKKETDGKPKEVTVRVEKTDYKKVGE